VLSLEPSEDADGVRDVFYDAYWTLKREPRPPGARGPARRQRWLGWFASADAHGEDWAGEVSKETRRPHSAWHLPEIAALVTAPSSCTCPRSPTASPRSDLSWSQVDA
jgi:hypothetical protein